MADEAVSENAVLTAPSTISEYYFTYGTLKKGMINHGTMAQTSAEFHSVCTTVEKFPLLVPDKPWCPNMSCPWLHRMAALDYQPGQGQNVKGEVYKITDGDIFTFDRLEGFNQDDPENPGQKKEDAYERRIVHIVTSSGEKLASWCYFMLNPNIINPLREMATKHQATAVEDYTKEMAEGGKMPKSPLPDGWELDESGIPQRSK